MRSLPAIFLTLLSALWLCIPVANAVEPVAVLELSSQSKLPPATLDLLTDAIRSAALDVLPRSNYTVMTRDNMLVMLEDMGLSTECVQGSCEVETGRNIGAKLVVAGSVADIGDTHIVSIKLYDCASGNLLAAEEARHRDQLTLLDTVKKSARSLFGRGLSLNSASASAPQSDSYSDGGASSFDLEMSAEHVVRFVSAPKGAAVSVGGRLLCTAPCSKALAGGRHEVTMTLARYDTASEWLEVRRGAQSSLKLTPQFGWLTIRTTPSGLAVTVDGEPAGASPIARREVAPGPTTVKVSAPGWAPASAKVVVSKAQEKVVQLSPAKIEGGLKVWAQDKDGNDMEAEVTLDGVRVGSTPWAGKLQVGQHALTVGGQKQSVSILARQVYEVTVTVGAGGSLGGEVIDRVGYKMVAIEPGSFMMGCTAGQSNCDSDEKPAHRVRLTRGFAMGATEVTQALWRAVMGDNPSHLKGKRRPVEKVSWDDVVSFCNKLSKLEGLKPAYTLGDGGVGQYPEVTYNRGADGYRMPTEAEWEYAARAGTDLLYAGSSSVDTVAWYSSNSDNTHPVATKKPNAWGLYDMSGNVFEWTYDWYGSSYYSNTSGSDPMGPRPGTVALRAASTRDRSELAFFAYDESRCCTDRVKRGGGWRDAVGFTQVAARSRNSPGARLANLGFRLARTIP